jgi:hypothetical protein
VDAVSNFGAEMKTADFCRQHDISAAMFYVWKAKKVAWK